MPTQDSNSLKIKTQILHTTLIQDDLYLIVHGRTCFILPFLPLYYNGIGTPPTQKPRTFSLNRVYIFLVYEFWICFSNHNKNLLHFDCSWLMVSFFFLINLVPQCYFILLKKSRGEFQKEEKALRAQSYYQNEEESEEKSVGVYWMKYEGGITKIFIQTLQSSSQDWNIN